MDVDEILAQLAAEGKEAPAWLGSLLESVKNQSEDPETLKTETEAAQLLKMSPGTLAVWRCCRTYPLKYVRVGSKIRYRLADLREFIALRTVEPKKARRNG